MNILFPYKLTLREREVLQCLAQGKTTRETATKLFLSPETIKIHRKNLLSKLDAKNAFQLGCKAISLKLVQL